MQMDYNDNIKNYDFIMIFVTIIMVLTQNYYWLIIYITYFIFMIYSTEDTKNQSLLIANRSLENTNFKEGDQILTTLTITNNSEYIFHGEIIDKLPDEAIISDGSNLHLLYLNPGETTNITYKMYFQRRGKYTIGPIDTREINTILSKERRSIIKLETEIVIVPFPDKISGYNLSPYSLTSIGGFFSSKLVGDGIDFTGVREYQNSDPMNRINWKSTAKFNKLFSNEFEINRTMNMIIVLDLTEESQEIADSSVRAALGLTEFLMNNRTKIGVITLGKYINYLPVKSGKRHLIEITEHLTNVNTTTSIKDTGLFQSRLKETLNKINKSNNDVILFSSLNRSENASILSSSLTKIGKLTVFAPTAIYSKQKNDLLYNVAKDILELRKLSIKMTLNQKGIRIYEWSPNIPFEKSLTHWRS